MSPFENALSTALAAHIGKTGKNGEEYIRHVLRVAASVSEDDQKIVALLHDVVEKSEITLDQLRRKGFSARIVDAVDSLTRREDEDYPDFVRRAASNPLALPVKIADLRDNLRACAHSADGGEKYRAALEMLGAAAAPQK